MRAHPSTFRAELVLSIYAPLSSMSLIGFFGLPETSVIEAMISRNVFPVNMQLVLIGVLDGGSDC